MVGGMGKNAINKLGEAGIQAFIRNAKAGKAGNTSKTKLSDGGGMNLMLTSAGTPVWRIKYRFGGEELASVQQLTRQYLKDGEFPYPSRYRPSAMRVFTSMGQPPLEDLIAKIIRSTSRSDLVQRILSR